MKWFGKDCQYQCNVWEEKEWENPNYKENTPVLIFCNHPNSLEDAEGNCRERICPLRWVD